MPVICPNCTACDFDGRKRRCPACGSLVHPLSTVTDKKKYARRGPGVGRFRCRPASSPTSALPGSEEKIRVFEERVARGEDIFHPDDAQAEPLKRVCYALKVYRDPFPADDDEFDLESFITSR